MPFDFRSVELLKKLIKETGYEAEIVLSSTWRLSPKLINAIEKYTGLKIKDKTPRLLSQLRGVEIQKYLEEHTEITNYVIIDDDSDMLEEQKEHFVKINSKYGFRRKDYERCLQILQKKKTDFFTSGDEEYDMHYHEEDWADEFERERNEEEIMRRLEEEK